MGDAGCSGAVYSGVSLVPKSDECGTENTVMSLRCNSWCVLGFGAISTDVSGLGSTMHSASVLQPDLLKMSGAVSVSANEVVAPVVEA